MTNSDMVSDQDSLLERLIQRAKAHRYISDAMATLVLAGLVLAVSIRFDLFGKLYREAQDYEFIGLDELFMVALVLSVALVFFSWRRISDLSTEIKARRSAELQAQELARQDPLTGLPNRRFFSEKLSQLFASEGSPQSFTLYMLDLNGFKHVNDLVGHLGGDAILMEFATRATAILPTDCVLVRLGGDEFAILQPGRRSSDDAYQFARRIVTTVTEPFNVAGIQIALGTAIGIARTPEDASTSQELLRRADIALYRAKSRGRLAIRAFEPEMDRDAVRGIEVERELRAALHSHEITICYQPIVGLATNQILAFEALARWSNARLGEIAPAVFIPIAERAGLISDLSDQLLRTACRDALTWDSDINLAFNLSALDLRDEALAVRITSILAQTGLDPRRLELEITESALIGDQDLARFVIGQLREAGIKIAIDDFGTGFASLAQLLQFRVDRIKIDRSFIGNLGLDRQADTIVRASVVLANGLELRTTAEGVETSDQLAILRSHGCTEGQGYLFGRPVPADQIGAARPEVLHGAYLASGKIPA